MNIIMLQVILGSAMREYIRGFGFSLSGAVDLDGNTYPDLAVGAPHSDQAVLLRYIVTIPLYFHSIFHGKR